MMSDLIWLALGFVAGAVALGVLHRLAQRPNSSAWVRKVDAVIKGGGPRPTLPK